MKKTGIFLIIFLSFLCNEFAYGKDRLVIIFKDGTSQRVTLAGPANSIKSINLQGAISTSGRGQIAIVAGTYGKNCGAAYGNKTEHLAQACNGKRHCEYIIDSKIIGDPVLGCSKDYFAEWNCGNDQILRSMLVSPEAGFEKKITLTCPQ
ncbi:MAG: hypothetical protein NTV58_08580 [Deltaproteobacteria bacterium]|nr:hypothetical protein [Deltaproteobacteria bacterium]